MSRLPWVYSRAPSPLFCKPLFGDTVGMSANPGCSRRIHLRAFPPSLHEKAGTDSDSAQKPRLLQPFWRRTLAYAYCICVLRTDYSPLQYYSSVLRKSCAVPESMLLSVKCMDMQSMDMPRYLPLYRIQCTLSSLRGSFTFDDLSTRSTEVPGTSGREHERIGGRQSLGYFSPGRTWPVCRRLSSPQEQPMLTQCVCSIRMVAEERQLLIQSRGGIGAAGRGPAGDMMALLWNALQDGNPAYSTEYGDRSTHTE